MKKRLKASASSKDGDEKDKRSVIEFGRMKRVRKSPRIARNKLKTFANTLETAIVVEEQEEGTTEKQVSRKRRKLICYEDDTSDVEKSKAATNIISASNYKNEGCEGRSTDCKIITGKGEKKKGCDGRSSDCRIISGKNIKKKASEGKSSDCKIISSLKGRRGKRRSVVNFRLTNSKKKNGIGMKKKKTDSDDMVDNDIADRKFSGKRKRKEDDKQRNAKRNEGFDEDGKVGDKRSGWFGIKTRSSPLQFFKGIAALQDQQKEAVRRMGFGKLLKFKVDGIPARLGHYVVDRFKPKKMQIRVPSGKIKIDKESIHKLLGIPREGIKLHKMDEMELRDPKVEEWKNRYPGRFVATTEIVKNIQSAEDEDTFEFRLDFLMLFLAVMVECHQQGRCKLGILNKLKAGTSFKDIDWCDYILRSMKKCKQKWKSCDKSKIFAGPLTILTLIYVESIECKGIQLGDSLLPIEYWNKNNLKRRERLEIKGTGFGTGKFVDFVQARKSVADEIDDNNPPFVLSDKVRDIGSMIDAVLKSRGKIEKKIMEVYDKEPENEDVLTLLARFDSVFECGFKKRQKESVDRSNASEAIRDVLNSLANEEKASDVAADNNNYTDEDEDGYGCGDDVMDNIEEIAGRSDVGGCIQQNVGSTMDKGGSTHNVDTVVEDGDLNQGFEDDVGGTIANQEGELGNVEKETTNSTINKMAKIREGGLDPVARGTTIVDDTPSFSLGLSQIGVQKEVVKLGRSEKGGCDSKNVGKTRVEGGSSTSKGAKVVEDDNVNQGSENGVTGTITSQEGGLGNAEKGTAYIRLDKNTEIREGGVDPVARGTTILDDTPSFSLGLSQIGVQKEVVKLGKTKIDDGPSFSLDLSQLGEKQQIDRPAKKYDNENKIYHSGFIPRYMLEKEGKEKTSDECGSGGNVKQTKGDKEKDKTKIGDAAVVESVTEVVGRGFGVGLRPAEMSVNEQEKAIEIECPRDKNNLESNAKQRDSCIAKLEKARRNPFKEEGASKKQTPGVDIASEVTKDEKNVWNLIFNNERVDSENVANINAKLKGKMSSRSSDNDERQETNSDLEVLFRSTYDVEGNRGWFKSLAAKQKVIDEVINCWVEVLNFEEKYKSPGSNRRLFVGTKAIIDWMLNDENTTEKQRTDKFSKSMKAAVYDNEELVDLKCFDLVLFPIVEFEHYYLIAFDLKNAAIGVIDNWGDLYPLVRLHDSNEYFSKDSAFKVKHLFVNYLRQVKHPKCRAISVAPITKETIPWSTKNNLHDCGVFLMRHMEKYMGVGEPFDCGFSRHGQRKLAELRRLRTKYAAKILLSDVNVLKKEIVVKAQGVDL